MNKFRGLDPKNLQVPETPVEASQQIGFGEMLHAEASGLVLPPNVATIADYVRLDGENLKKLYGSALIQQGVTLPADIVSLKQVFHTGSHRHLVGMFPHSSGGYAGYIVGEGNVGSFGSESANGRHECVFSAMDILFTSSYIAKVAQYNLGAWSLTDNGPTAYFADSFGDRIVCLQADGDPQAAQWSEDGYTSENGDPWINDNTNAVNKSIWCDTHASSVDQLVGFVPIGPNIAALFRARSIWRMFETGDINVSLGATVWIDGLGTTWEKTIADIGIGAIFLGSDKGVYIFTANGEIVPVGTQVVPIINAQSFVDFDPYIHGSYDAASGQYWLCLPTVTLIFDVKRFIQQRKIVWTRFPVALLASAGAESGGFGNAGIAANLRTGMIFVDTARNIHYMDPSATTLMGSNFTGCWRSATLNKVGTSACLRKLIIRYKASGTSSITVKVSKDGGSTWSYTASIGLSQTAGDEIAVAKCAPEVGGKDLRVQLEFDQTVDYSIIGFTPVLEDLGSLEYD